MTTMAIHWLVGRYEDMAYQLKISAPYKANYSVLGGYVFN